MTLKKIIDIADKTYPDGLIGLYFNEKTGRAKKTTSPGYGDGLARFICMELCETYDKDASDEKQLAEAIRVMETAQREVQDVVTALHKTQERIPEEANAQ